MIHYPYWLTYPYFFSTDKQVGIDNCNCTVRTSTITRNPLHVHDSPSVQIQYPYRLPYPYFESTDKWVDLGIGSTDSRTPVYCEKTPLFTIKFRENFSANSQGKYEIEESLAHPCFKTTHDTSNFKRCFKGYFLFLSSLLTSRAFSWSPMNW
jgi:hypothetical protein